MQVTTEKGLQVLLYKVIPILLLLYTHTCIEKEGEKEISSTNMQEEIKGAREHIEKTSNPTTGEEQTEVENPFTSTLTVRQNQPNQENEIFKNRDSFYINILNRISSSKLLVEILKDLNKMKIEDLNYKEIIYNYLVFNADHKILRKIVEKMLINPDLYNLNEDKKNTELNAFFTHVSENGLAKIMQAMFKPEKRTILNFLNIIKKENRTKEYLKKLFEKLDSNNLIKMEIAIYKLTPESTINNIENGMREVSTIFSSTKVEEILTLLNNPEEIKKNDNIFLIYEYILEDTSVFVNYLFEKAIENQKLHTLLNIIIINNGKNNEKDKISIKNIILLKIRFNLRLFNYVEAIINTIYSLSPRNFIEDFQNDNNTINSERSIARSSTTLSSISITQESLIPKRIKFLNSIKSLISSNNNDEYEGVRL